MQEPIGHPSLHMQTALQKFPARPLTPDERAVFDEWISAAGDIALAYVSSRQSDDPVLKNRIVVANEVGGEPSHFVFALAGRNIWLVFGKGQRIRLQRHKTLLTALNSIRPVLADSKPAGSSTQVKQD